MHHIPDALRFFQDKCLASNESPLTDVEEDPNPEAKEYCAFGFKVSGYNCLFRQAKTTGTRPGLFVTLWKRPKKEIEPFDKNDLIDFVIVATNSPIGNRGFFIFSREVLLKKGIFSEKEKARKGKLAFRIFPPWSLDFVPLNPVKSENMSASALKTQLWQLDYYLKEADTLNLTLFRNMPDKK